MYANEARNLLLWPASVLKGNSRWKVHVLHFSKTNGSYLNQEYSVRGKGSTFKQFIYFLFADFCDLFSYYSRTKTAASVVWQFSVSEEKSSGWDVLFSVFAQLFRRNTSETPSSCVKSVTDMIPTLFQFRICSHWFVAVVSVWNVSSPLFFLSVFRDFH